MQEFEIILKSLSWCGFEESISRKGITLRLSYIIYDKKNLCLIFNSIITLHILFSYYIIFSLILSLTSLSFPFSTDDGAIKKKL